MNITDLGLRCVYSIASYMWELRTKVERHGILAGHGLIEKDFFKETVSYSSYMTVDVAKSGYVIKSGWGKDPPDDVVNTVHSQQKEVKPPHLKSSSYNLTFTIENFS